MYAVWGTCIQNIPEFTTGIDRGAVHHAVWGGGIVDLMADADAARTTIDHSGDRRPPEPRVRQPDRPITVQRLRLADFILIVLRPEQYASAGGARLQRKEESTLASYTDAILPPTRYDARPP